MKKELEKKILKKMYRMETRRTFADILFTTISLLVVASGLFLLATVLFEIIIEQKTLESFQLLSEDPEIMWKYMGDLVQYLYYEIPHTILIILIALLLLCLYIIYLVLKNFRKTKNKINAIAKFTFHKK